MCHIKTKSNIKNQGDINNLVAGLINRQCTPFHKSKSVEMAMYHTEGAGIPVEKKALDELICIRLDTLVRNDFIAYKKGTYYPNTIMSYV